MAIFYIGITFLVLHEADAIRCKEWRILPGLSLLPDRVGRLLFILAHIPIFYFLYFLLTNEAGIADFRLGLNIFLIVHLALHLLYLKHKRNEFKDWISWTFIAGAGVCGLSDLILNL